MQSIYTQSLSKSISCLPYEEIIYNLSMAAAHISEPTMSHFIALEVGTGFQYQVYIPL